MLRKRLALALVAAAILAVPASAAHSAVTLLGSVGPGFDISLKNAKHLTPGRYKLVVNDKSSSHSFRLKGPNVNVGTTVGGSGFKTFTVTLKRGLYTFYCAPHASFMEGTFRVK